MGTTPLKEWTRWIPLIALACTALDCGSPSSPTAPPVDPGPGVLTMAPVACFTVSPDPPEIDAGGSLSFDAACSEHVASAATFRWQLGDGRADAGPKIDARYRQAGDYVVELTLANGETLSTATATVHVRPRLAACFAFQQVIDGTNPCTVDFDASCAAGDVREFRWFFEGGPFPPASLPDVNLTTTAPQIQYSWAGDMECLAFRRFERTVRLTVVDENGLTDTHAEVVRFTVPFLRQ